MALSDRPGPFPRDYGRFSTVVSLASGDDDWELNNGSSPNDSILRSSLLRKTTWEKGA